MQEFSQLLYETSFDSTATAEEAIVKLSPLRDWIKSNVPQRLFRYRKVNDYSLSALRDDEIWGSTILEFNDPYECTPCYDIKQFTEHLRQMFSPDAIKQIISLVKTGRMPQAYLRLIPKDALDILKQALATYSEDEVVVSIAHANMSSLDKVVADWNQIINSFFLGIKQAESETHIACFSECCNSSLMWGHYADSHKGFCVEYDFHAALQNCAMNCSSPAQCNNFMLNLPIAPVTYSDSRLDATSYLPTIIQGHLASVTNAPVDIYFLDMLLLAKCQLLKSSDWAYEREWRMAFRTPYEKYVPHKCIAKLKPNGIYLGSRMSADDQNSIYEICRSKGIPCYIMLQNYMGQDFTLQPQPYEEFLKAIRS